MLMYALLPLLFLQVTNGFLTFPSTIPNCPSFTCGNTLNITYPFWLSTPESTSFCGYPDLQITCNHTTPTFHTLSSTYTVKSIDPTAKTISLIDSTILGLACPRPIRNVTIPFSALIYAPSVTYLVFFFDCNLTFYKGPRIPEEYRATCLDGLAGVSYVFDGVPKAYSGLYAACTGKTMMVPVLRGASRAFATAMSEGFELMWRDPELSDCRGCERSGGRCGYSNQTETGLAFQCFCEDGLWHGGDCNRHGTPSNKVLKIGIGVGAVIIALVIIFVVLWLFKPWIWGKFYASSNDGSVETFLRTRGHLAIKRYKYSQVKQMTRSFSAKLGQGGYGTVYKGQLCNGTPVAVKLLREMKGSGEEFINEVASIGRTNHVNVVGLLGFCSEGSMRALIYEFMPNGSLEKYLFVGDTRTSNPLGWEQLQGIALGIARGLEYLHRGCTTPIVHFDIKPHNILLDEDLSPKISDFGLAKLCKTRESILSRVEARGTIGYIAPELFFRSFGPASSKSDVYSYGMMVLEMVGGRRNVESRVENTSEIYFPHWIYDHLDQNLGPRAVGDPVEGEVARKMALVGLWCIQTNPSSRPSISRVVDMLEGRVDDLEIPPKPYIYSPATSRCNSSIDSCPVLDCSS